jgi:hypothetical protein
MNICYCYCYFIVNILKQSIWVLAISKMEIPMVTTQHNIISGSNSKSLLFSLTKISE